MNQLFRSISVFLVKLNKKPIVDTDSSSISSIFVKVTNLLLLVKTLTRKTIILNIIFRNFQI